MTTIANPLSLHRWMPTFAVAGAGMSPVDRTRPASLGDGPPVPSPEMSHEEQERGRSDPERGGGRTSSPFGGAPDPTGNSGRRLDLFA